MVNQRDGNAVDERLAVLRCRPTHDEKTEPEWRSCNAREDLDGAERVTPISGNPGQLFVIDAALDDLARRSFDDRRFPDPRYPAFFCAPSR